MSDSVTNVQIEDVLSSIRKLVSEEVRAQSRDARKPAPPSANAVAQQEPDSEDRLLLTPALRVQPGAVAERIEEAPFTHAEEPHEEADLLDLMARVRAAGTQQATIEAKRPVGIAPVAQPKPAEPVMQATEEAVRSALFSLGDPDRASILTGDADSPVTKGDEPDGDASVEAPAVSSSLADEPAVHRSTHDDLDFASSVRSKTDTVDEDISETVPKFLHRSGITSLGQRIAEVESVVSTSGGDWEPEADEETEASPGPQMSSVPWDDPEADRDMVAPEALPEDDVSQDVAEDMAEDQPDDSADWTVEPEERQSEVRDIAQFARRHAEPPAAKGNDAPAALAEDRPDTEDNLAASTLDDIVDASEDAPATLSLDEGALESLGSTIAEDDRAPLDETDFEDFAAAALEEAAEPSEDELTEAEVMDDAFESVEEEEIEAYVAQAEDMVEAEPFDEDLETLSSDETTLLDEEMLRDLVSEIVRQELQGALGERITRNVRKLVRREIHRALSAQDLG